VVFDKANPASLQWIQDHTAELVQGISKSSRDAIKALVEKAFVKGVAPEKAAKQIAKIIGLDDRRAAAVDTLRQTILDSPGRIVYAGDRRIAVPEDVSEGFADDWADRYSDDLVDDRAESIARTEIIAAENGGQQALWEQAQEDGLLSSTQTRRWSATGDKRCCDVCNDYLDGQEVAFDEPFDADGEEVDMPPAHPNCRCSMTLGKVQGVPVDQEPVDAAARFAGGPGSGNFGHEGRPGEIGGSSEAGGGGEKAKNPANGMNTYRKEFGRRQREDKARAKQGLPPLQRSPIAKMRAEGRLPKVGKPEPAAAVKPVAHEAPKPIEPPVAPPVAPEPVNVPPEGPPGLGASEHSLASTPPSGDKPLGGGVSETYRVRLKDGTDAVFKPVSGEPSHMRPTIDHGIQAEREAGAYEVAKAMGYADLVASTVVRDDFPYHTRPERVWFRTKEAALAGAKPGAVVSRVPGGAGYYASTPGVAKTDRGSLQAWQPGRQAGDSKEPYGKNPGDIGRAAVFDHVVGNTDRHQGNWMVDDAGKIHLIDHGLAFPHEERQGPGNFDIIRHVGKDPFGVQKGDRGFGDFIKMRDHALAQASKIEAAMRKVGLDKGPKGEARMRALRARLDRLATSTSWEEFSKRSTGH
jgi:hypothetical protein